MSKVSKKSFVFNYEWQEVLKDYPAEVRLEVYDAIIEYAKSGTLFELKPLAKMAFSFIKLQIDYNNEKYEEIVEKRREAGRKGMQKRYAKSETNITSDNITNKCYQKVTNVTDNDNDIVNDNDNGNDNDLKKDISKKKSPKKEMDLSFVAPEFMPVFTRWLDYKRKRGETYKVGWAVKSCYNKLLELSNNDPLQAEAIIEQSFANNWAGIFKLKIDGNNRSNYTSKQEANQYAVEQFIAKRRAKEQGLVGEVEKPF